MTPREGTAREIVTYPANILFRVCDAATAISFETGDVEQTAADLRETMRVLLERTGKRALGLAAPQIGINLRMFVMAQWPGAFVNPTIEYVPGERRAEAERCYSLPDLELRVTRAARIKMRYLTVGGEERATKMRDTDARVAQHEFDHLDGVLITQRADHLDSLPVGFIDKPPGA